MAGDTEWSFWCSCGENFHTREEWQLYRGEELRMFLEKQAAAKKKRPQRKR
jgi:hypothetical protein